MWILIFGWSFGREMATYDYQELNCLFRSGFVELAAAGWFCDRTVSIRRSRFEDAAWLGDPSSAMQATLGFKDTS